VSTLGERGLVFTSGEQRLVGVLAQPEDAGDVAVLIMVGGPQYRVGSHRQFTLLARDLARHGYTSLRFDYAGMGDSEGKRARFDAVHADVDAAIAALQVAAPEVRRIVLFGLCDAASMAMIHAPTRPEIAGLVLLNPWVHEGEYLPEVRLSRYRSQLATGHSWRRLLTRPGDVVAGLSGFVSASVAALRTRLLPNAPVPTFVDAMRKGLDAFEGRVLILLSEDDLTAKEFSALASRDERWFEVLGERGVETHELPDTDHTFSRPGGQSRLQELVADWLGRSS